MKKIILLIIGVTFLFVGYKNLPGTMSNGAPSASTGAPDEKHCSSTGCHTGFAPNSGVAELSANVGGGITQYELGKTYPVTVTISNPGLVRFGFQVVALKNSDNTNAGTIKVVETDRTQTIEGYGKTSDRKYITDTYEGTKAISTGLGKWSFEWTAPQENVGPITFYVASVAANDDGTDAGDYTYSKSITINDPAISWSVYPSVSSSAFNINCSGIPIDNLKIYSSSGEKVFEKTNIETGTMNLNLNQPCGIYFLSVNQNGKTDVKKILISR